MVNTSRVCTSSSYVERSLKMFAKRSITWMRTIKKRLDATTLGIVNYCTQGNDGNHEAFVDTLKTFTGGSVDLDKDESNGIAVITLNHPKKKNALSGKMMVDLKQIVENLEGWYEGKGIILQGAQGTFCSGGDLDTVKNILTPELGYQMSDYMHDTVTRLLHLPMLSVALVQGSALGGGAELLTSCDFRLLTHQARVGFVQTRMGVVTGWGGGTHLVKLIGKTKALDLLCSGRVLDSQECKRIGFADDVIPDTDNALDVTKSWLMQYCDKDAKLIRTVKTIATIADDTDVDTSLEVEKDLFRVIWGGDLQKKALGDNIKH